MGLIKMMKDSAVISSNKDFEKMIGTLESVLDDVKRNKKDFDEAIKLDDFADAGSYLTWSHDRIMEITYNIKFPSYSLRSLIEVDCEMIRVKSE